MSATATAAPPPKAAGPSSNPLDLLRQLAGARPAKSKKPAAPVAERPDMGPTIKGWHEAKKLADQYTSVQKTFAAQIIAAASAERLAACRRAGQVLTTVRLDGGPEAGGLGVTVTQTSRYCRLPDEKPEQQARRDELLAAFGDDAPRYFAEQLEVTLADGAADRDDYQAFLAEYVGVLIGHFGERFAQWFKVTRSFAPTQAFHNDYALRPDVEAKARPFVDDETIKPYAPSVKV